MIYPVTLHYTTYICCTVVRHFTDNRWRSSWTGKRAGNITRASMHSCCPIQQRGMWCCVNNWHLLVSHSLSPPTTVVAVVDQIKKRFSVGDSWLNRLLSILLLHLRRDSIPLVGQHQVQTVNILLPIVPDGERIWILTSANNGFWWIVWRQE